MNKWIAEVESSGATAVRQVSADDRLEANVQQAHTELQLDSEWQLDRPRKGLNQRLGDLFAVDPVVRVESHVLGEVVLWVRDEASSPVDALEVAYTHEELKWLVGKSPDELRAIHAAKRELDGALVGFTGAGG